MNRVLEIMRQAEEKNWCTRPGCTTCGSNEYRSALRSLNDGARKGLGSGLASVDLRELQTLRDWSDSVQIALVEAAASDQLDEVLEAWLPEIPAHPRVADLVLFYFVKRGALIAGMSVDILKTWVNACVELAVSTQDSSLIESLLYSAPDALKDHADGLEVAKSVARRNRKVRLALQRSW